MNSAYKERQSWSDVIEPPGRGASLRTRRRLVLLGLRFVMSAIGVCRPTRGASDPQWAAVLRGMCPNADAIYLGRVY